MRNKSAASSVHGVNRAGAESTRLTVLMTGSLGKAADASDEPPVQFQVSPGTIQLAAGQTKLRLASVDRKVGSLWLKPCKDTEADRREEVSVIFGQC